jgi:hypothetical protein
MKGFSFTEDLKKFAANADPGIVVRKVAMEVFTGVILMTPVKSGRARGNWQTSITTPIEEEIDTKDQNRGLNELADIVNKQQGDESIFLSNNLPYIEVLENGSSIQAPAGMVKVTLTRFSGIVEDAVKG